MIAKTDWAAISREIHAGEVADEQRQLKEWHSLQLEVSKRLEGVPWKPRTIRR